MKKDNIIGILFISVLALAEIFCILYYLGIIKLAWYLGIALHGLCFFVKITISIIAEMHNYKLII